MSLENGEILQQRYLVNTVVKAGGMGSIYLAHDNNLDGACAIKEMHPTDDNWVTRRFREEAQLLSQLQHPNIPRVRDFFQLEREGGTLCYIVMDFVQGVTLAHELEQALKTGKPGLDSAMGRNIALEMLGVLEYLHALTPPIIHRDVKPANIIRDSENGKLYLVDFGLARGTSEHTQTTAGTLMFCPPEQMLGKADVRSDLYALGASLYLLMTGQPIQMGRYVPVMVQRADIEPQLAETIDKVLQLDPDQRFQNAAEMRTFLTQPYVTAAKPNPWPKRMGTAAVLALALGLIGLKPLLQRHPVAATPTASATPVAVASPPINPVADPNALPPVPITVTEVEAKPTWFLREKFVPAGQLVTANLRMIQQLTDYATQQGVTGTGYIRWHNPTGSDYDMETGLILPGKRPAGQGSIQAGSLPGGRVITLTHSGGYGRIQERYDELRQWAVDHHLEVDKAPWGVYRVTSLQQPDQSRWETDIYYLIVP